jgi:hypothetical protein
MEIKELREKIAKSENADEFENVEATVTYNQINVNVKLQGILGIFKYFNKQQELWNKKEESLPNQLKQCKSHFTQLSKQILNFINSNLESDSRAFQNNWQQLRQQLQANTAGRSFPVLTADSPTTDFLIDIYSNYRNSYGSAYSYLIKNNVGNLNKRDQLMGCILAYEFDLQEHTEIQQRRNNEKISLGLLRNKLEELLSETENSAQKIINETEKEFQEYVKAVDELKESKTGIFDKWFGKSKQDFTSFHESAKKDAKDLREVYREGLRFAGPVRYWEKRALEMKKNGAMWIKWFGAAVTVAALSIFFLLWLIPESMTASLFNGEPAAIKWTLLFITYISFLAYGVRTFSKLTFSSYHLARDAEEREQLTHIYLALKKDADVDEKDRTLILQALFSRAETGLLKDDSAPTMPASVIEKFGEV